MRLTATLALVLALTACGGGEKPAAAKPAGCHFPRLWYPGALTGHSMNTVTPGERAELLKRAGLPDRGTDIVVDRKGSAIQAVLFRVRSGVDAQLRRIKAQPRPRGATVTEPLAHVTMIARGDSALEYGRKGCALFVGAGDGETVDALFSAMWAL